MEAENLKKENSKSKFKQAFLTLIFLFSIALVVYGAIKLIIAFYSSTPKFESIVFITLGIILAGVIDVIIQFNYVIDVFSNLITKLINTNENINQQKNNRTYPPNFLTKEIIINAENPQEELQRLKEQNPILAAELEKILSVLGGTKQPKEETLQNLSIEQLEKKLNKAINNNEFEKAAEIRDEIAKRKK